MRETRNNCFWSKIRNTTLLQAKTNKHEWRRTLLLLFGTRAYLFSPNKGSCCIFSTRNSWCKVLASYGVITQSVIQSLLTLFKKVQKSLCIWLSVCPSNCARSNSRKYSSNVMKCIFNVHI